MDIPHPTSSASAMTGSDKLFIVFLILVLGLVTWLMFLATPAGEAFPAQLAGLLAAFVGMLVGSLGPQAIRNAHASHHRLAGT